MPSIKEIGRAILRSDVDQLLRGLTFKDPSVCELQMSETSGLQTSNFQTSKNQNSLHDLSFLK